MDKTAMPSPQNGTTGAAASPNLLRAMQLTAGSTDQG